MSRSPHDDYQRRRWLRNDAHLWLRQDYARFLPPGWQQKYNANQPRVPAGHTNGGQWTSGAYGGGIGLPFAGRFPGLDDLSAFAQADRDTVTSNQIAGVVRICIASGRSLSLVSGARMYTVTYDCAGGRSIVRSGLGWSFPGFIIDPLQ